jgi:hypothetical protein
MPRSVLGVVFLVLVSCVEEPEAPALPAADEACTSEGACASELSCVRLICRDNSGPKIDLRSPAPSTAFAGEVDRLWVFVHVDLAVGDRVELSVDPNGDAPHFFEFVEFPVGTINTELVLPGPLAVGPHRARARVLSAQGQPYSNPSASDEIVFFVRDPELPSTPQVAIVWPPHGYEHRRGNPLEVEVAVLPDSFTFVYSGSHCAPLPDCEPAFAAECEGECGAVSRSGHGKFFTEPDWPGCLTDTPISCAVRYITTTSVIDGFRARGTITGARFDDLGPFPLQASLNYTNHSPYPTTTSVIYEAITLQVVE